MTDPASTALAAPRLSLGDGVAAYKAAVERARTEDWATRLFARGADAGRGLWVRCHRLALRGNNCGCKCGTISFARSMTDVEQR